MSEGGLCPVCDSDDHSTVNVRVPPGESFGGGPSDRRHWGGKNISRCGDCGVVFDPSVSEDDGEDEDANHDGGDR